MINAGHWCEPNGTCGGSVGVILSLASSWIMGLPINRNAFVFSDRPDYIFIGAPGGLQVCPWTALRPAPKAADADAAIEEAINASRRLKLESTFQHGRLP